MLPTGGLPRRRLSTCGNSPLLVVELIAAALQAGNYVAVVNWPQLLLTQLVDYGINVERLVLIPHPGADPLGVVGMLVDGIDLVVYHDAGGGAVRNRQLPPTQIRPLTAKLRRGCAAVLVVGAQVSHAAVQISATPIHIHGLGYGTGRIRGIELAVAVTVQGRPAQHRQLMVTATGFTRPTRAAEGRLRCRNAV
ncbi:hypothetical protein ACFPVT_09670 [Corynebacterium choanae]|nr:hypothetical protein [Corynebacterium choanae]